MASLPLRKNKGRQKVAMELMKKDSNRLVTFSKRRSGLFKKASELCTLCGAEILIIVFSPANKAFSFGHPLTETIVNRWLIGNGFLPHPQIPGGADNDPEVQNMNNELTFLKEKLENTRKVTEEILEQRKIKEPSSLRFLAPVEQLTLSELKEFSQTLTTMRDQVYEHGKRLYEAYGGSRLQEYPNEGYFHPSGMLGGESQNPNYNLTFDNIHIPVAMPLGNDPSQMMIVPHPMVGGSNDNSAIPMAPNPRGAFEDPSMVMMASSGFGSQFYVASFDPYSSTPNVMGAVFTPPTMMDPMNRPSNPIEGKSNDGGQVVPSGGASSSFLRLLTGGGEGSSSSAPLNPRSGEGSSSNPFNRASAPLNPRSGEGSSSNPFNRAFAPLNPRSGEGSSSNPFNRQGPHALFNPHRGGGSISHSFNSQGGWGNSFAPFNPQSGGGGTSSAPFNPQRGEGSSSAPFNPRVGEGNSPAPFNLRIGEGSSFAPFNPRRGEGSSSARFNPQGGEGTSFTPSNRGGKDTSSNPSNP